MKKVISLCLAMLLACGVLTVGASAASKPIHVYDLLKYDADSSTNVCRTIGIFFENQYTRYDETKPITFENASGTIVANCVPRADNNRMLDLYTPDGRFGVALNPTLLYYLVIPEGAYSAENGDCNAAYRGEYNGVYLSNAGKTFTTTDLGISNFLAGKVVETKLYSGKLLVSAAYDTLLHGKDCVLLYKIVNSKDTLIGIYSVSAYKSGRADIDFGGVEIDRYASYKLHVQYGTFYGGSTINAHSDYLLSGKKLLGLAENYPALDLLIEWFGANHWTLEAVTTALKALAYVRLVDKALYNDVRDYIRARK